MHELDSESETNLGGVAPEVVIMVRDAANYLTAMSVQVRVVSGLRTAFQQNRLFAQGRSAPGKIVTNARAGQSMHNYGLAVDVVPFLEGGNGALNWQVSTPQFQHMVAAFKNAGLDWGGDWLGSLGDFDHFQISGLGASPTAAMQADYGAGTTDLTAIWTKATTGEYA